MKRKKKKKLMKLHNLRNWWDSGPQLQQVNFFLFSFKKKKKRLLICCDLKANNLLICDLLC